MEGWLQNLLMCPVCRGSVTEDDAPACERCGPFLVVDGQPALIDFPSSILAADDFKARGGASPVSRRPSLKASLLHGGNPVAKRIAEAFARDLSPGSTVLIIGGGERGVGTEALYAADLRRVGTDIYPTKNTCLLADGHKLPFKDDSFDAVWIQAVLEHVLDPHTVAAEIARVVKTGGLVFADTPFMQQVHEGAYDFTRFTVSGHRWLFRHFELIEAGVTAGSGTALLWSLQYWLRSVTGRHGLAQFAALPFFWVRLINGEGRKNNDAASGVFFYGRKATAPIRPRDMIDFYAAQR